jgi:hypothetical protein
MFTTGSGAQGQTDIETVTLAIGTPVAIAQDLELSGQLDDCSGGQGVCPPGQPGSPYYLGPVSETFSDVKAVFQIDPITPGVSYTTASGHSYR